MQKILKTIYGIDVCVKESKIHRKGLFVLQDIPEGTRVIEYVGELISKRESDRREKINDAKGETYIFEIPDSRWDVDGETGGNESIYVNHSCDPNLDAIYENGRIFFDSNRAIGAGEELTLDYYFSKDSKKEKCRCGAINCRGVINGE